jgi:hypothetical protein
MVARGSWLALALLASSANARAQAPEAPVIASAPHRTPTPSAETATPPQYQLDAFVRVRYQESFVWVSPRTHAIIARDYPQPSATEAALNALRDTAREHDGFALARADLSLAAHPNPHLRGEVRLDFARLLSSEEVSDTVRELYGEWTPARGLALVAGAFAAPFSLHELFESHAFELSPESPSHEFLEHLRYYGRDVGVMVRLAPLAKADALQLDLAALDGGATGAQDYRGPGLFNARLSGEPLKHLRLEAAASVRPRPIRAWWEEFRYRYQAYDSGTALEANAAFSLSHFTVRAEWMAGQRTDNDVQVPLAFRRGAAHSFQAIWGMVAAHFPVRRLTLVPALSGEWIDTDPEHPYVGQILHLSAGISVEFPGKVRALCELSRHLVEAGTRNFSFDIVRYDTDRTTGTLQLQMEL